MRRCHASFSRFLAVLVTGACLVSLVGCGGGSGLSGPTGTVTGKVTYNGANVPAGCQVTFIHQETSTPAKGEVADDGTYSLTMLGERKVLAGDYKISVATAVEEDISADEEAYAAEMMGGSSASSEPPPFPAIFFSPTTSGLTFTVAEGENTYDIKMTD